MNKTEFRVLQELKYKSGQIDRRKFITSVLPASVMNVMSTVYSAFVSENTLFTNNNKVKIKYLIILL